MRGEPVVGIQPSVMRWARESAGMSVDDVANRLKRQLAEVESWESGQGAPTYPQLERLAYELYKRPLAVFFLPAPPQEVSPKQQFRTLPEEDLASLSRDTYLHLRKARAYQVGLEDLYSHINPAPRKIWHHISLNWDQDLAAQATLIREELGIDSASQAGWGNDDRALKAWRAAIEKAGIFVFKDSFKQDSISGFCLRDQDFPLIYINNSTTKTRQIFSLLHELAHILFNVSGISKFDSSYVTALPAREQALEVFCNAVAAEVLIPREEFARVTAMAPGNVEALGDTYFSAIARHFGVSREAILRRFLNEGRATKVFYEGKAEEWNAQMSEREPGGGSWYASKGAYLSDTLLREVFARRLRGQLSSERAAEYLGVKAANIPGLEDLVLHRTSN